MIYEHNPTKLFDSDSESCDTVPCNDTDDEYSVSARVILQEEEEAVREKNEEGFSVPTGVVPFAAAGDEEEGSDEYYDSEECQVGEEEEEQEEEGTYYDAQQYGEEEVVEEFEKEEEEEESLISNDISAYSEMSIDMDVYNGVDEIAVVKEEMQVDGSGCGWYPIIDEDIEMEDVPYIDVEMLDADEGVVMMLIEDEDVEMEEAADMMDVDGEFW
ncbi:unnamed protein product [Mucor circinelloides]